MGKKGVTLIELLIVMVVIGIIAVFSITAVTNIIANSREESFVNTARAMVDSAKKAHTQNESFFNDGKATLQELKDNHYIEVSEKDPWGNLYDFTNSFVTVETVLIKTDGSIYLSTSQHLATKSLFQVQLVSETATIGYESPLEIFDNNDVIYLDNPSGSVINGIIENITGNVTTTVNGNSDNDSISIDSDLTGSGQVNTFEGDDIVEIAGDVRSRASINTGAGNDTISFDMLRGRSTVNAGEGNDILTIREVRYHTVIDMGDGEDVVTISSILGNYRGSISMGAGDDILTIRDEGTPFQGVNGTFTGGNGSDVLNLPDVDSARWTQISFMFSGFETINLSDTTITN